MRTLTIGKAARYAEVGIETIRFYERRGLIEQPPRRESGYRQYPESVVLRLRFVKRAKELGFSLREIKELLSLRLDSTATCCDVKKRSEVKIDDIEEKIKTLQKMKKALTTLVGACGGHGPISDCPILEVLDSKEVLINNL